MKLLYQLNTITNYKLLFLSLAFSSMSINALCQGNSQNIREVYSEYSIQYHFAVPEGTDIDSLHELDFTRILTPDEDHTELYEFNSNSECQITNSFIKLDRGDFKANNEIEKSVQNKEGMRLYDPLGNEILFVPNDSLSAKWIEPINSATSVSEFGLYPLLTTPGPDLVNTLSGLGYTVLVNSNNILTAVKSDHEIILDPNDLTIEERFFQENEIERINVEAYKQVSSNYMIPKWEITKTYETLFSGIVMQRTKVKSYLLYETFNNGQSEFRYEGDNGTITRKGAELNYYEKTEKLNDKLKVYPNPAVNRINVSVPVFASESLTIEVLNHQGKIIDRFSGIPAGHKLPINISEYSSGVYLLRCGKGNLWQSVKFIKQ